MFLVSAPTPQTHLAKTQNAPKQNDSAAVDAAGDAAADDDGVEDAFELVAEVPERVRTGLWVGDCFVYTNAAWRLNYCVGGEVRELLCCCVVFAWLLLRFACRQAVKTSKTSTCCSRARAWAKQTPQFKTQQTLTGKT